MCQGRAYLHVSPQLGVRQFARHCQSSDDCSQSGNDMRTLTYHLVYLNPCIVVGIGIIMKMQKEEHAKGLHEEAKTVRTMAVFANSRI